MTVAAEPGQVFDVAVAGGGPAGSTVAALLARAGHAVLVCDAARFPRHKICGEYVPPAAVAAFSDLGVLDAVLDLSPRRHVGMAVVAPGGARVLGRYGEPEQRGFSMRRYDLDPVLLENARSSGAVVREGTRVQAVTRCSDGLFELTLSGHPAPARARAIVGADGRNSFVARALGLRRPERRHRRWAVMGHFEQVDAPGDHGEMIVTGYGYCGINPLPGGLANVCVVLDPHRPARGASSRRGAPRAAGLPGRNGLAAFFRERIEEHALTRRRLRHARLSAGLWATGPMACGSSTPVADGALLVGDAAGFFDPFTGEGIAMALRGGTMAAAVLGAALLRGDLSARALSPYASARRAAFATRLRLDRILQAVLARPRLADWVARRLNRDQDLADLLARVTGDTADAALVVRPRFVARLLLA